MLKNKYGYVDNKTREYVITDPRTPRPWFNYIWNENYTGLISHTGGGFSYYQSARDNRITRMRYNSLPWDRPGRYIYIKDTETGQYWSLSWAPTLNIDYDKYECRHGSGYVRITTEYKKIRAILTYFVPLNDAGEIWHVEIEDLSGKDRKLEVYSYTELLMGNALNDLINQPNDKHFTDIHFDKEHGTLVATRRYWVLNKGVSVKQPNIDWQYRVLFTSTLPIKGFDASLDKFIGKWRSEANPQAIENSKMCNTEITAGDPCAALQSELNLKAKNKTFFTTILMLSDKKNSDSPFNVIGGKHLKEIKKQEYVEKEFKALKDKWDTIYSNIEINTPDEELNTMLGTWNYYQTHVTFDMARNAGYYHGGLLFGTGMRDQFQDIFGVLLSDPSRVRERLLNTMQYQFMNGSTLHNYFKLVKTGERTNHSDTPLWIPLGVAAYIKETGDTSILDELVSFYDEGKTKVLDHCILAIKYALSETGEHGLPKIMNGDWNDTLDHIGSAGKGETVWGAFFLAYTLKETVELLEYIQEKGQASELLKEYIKLKETINKIAWDGDWYLRAFRDNGTAVGSAKDEQGKLFLNAQSWSVISGVADDERAQKALEACKAYLETPLGMQICWPSYTRIDDTVGLISRCVPGKKENGAIFNHASSWYVMAAFMNDNIEDAYRIYSKMLPLNSSEEAGIDRYETEPYVYSEYITSSDHETVGQASHSWLTGSAVWMHYIGMSYLLGIRADYHGLTIDPKIPAYWNGFTIKRNFRGKTLNIEVLNPDHLNSGVKTMLVNGKTISGNFLDPSILNEKIINISITLTN
ncbi:MAG: glycosyl transferase family 36 [Candidatus Marinimicrobia bacterium]|nr:glycosyl transferase family 36 [Candidatus Neomarinimicrobiota bacterium]